MPDNPLNFKREYDEDRKSRPLFANHIGANSVFHIHTNGVNNNTTATGTRIFYHPGRFADQELAKSVSCYMKELIQAQEPYENFLVPEQPEARNYEENRLAVMPSVLIEVAFHTNPNDALALQDPVFREAAMKGVEKGHRLYMQSEPCTHFAITEIPASSGPHGGNARVDVSYEGFPQYPVTAILELASCPPGFTCTPGQAIFGEEANPLSYNISCNTTPGTPPATATWRTTLIDSDNVETASIEHPVTCGIPGNSQGETATSYRIPLIGSMFKN